MEVVNGCDAPIALREAVDVEYGIHRSEDRENWTGKTLLKNYVAISEALRPSKLNLMANKTRGGGVGSTPLV